MPGEEFTLSVKFKKRVCRGCDKSQDFIFSKKIAKKGVQLFVNSQGSAWCGRLCPTCRNMRDIARAREKGIHKKIDDVIAPHIKKSRDAERVAERYLKLMGMRDIVLTTAWGADITFTEIDGQSKTCEVKVVLRDPNGNSYFTTPVTKKRVNDDYFAAIFPNGDMLMESMSLHHKKATRCGRRTFTMEMIYDRI